MAKDFFGSLGETLTKTAKELSGRAEEVYETQRLKNKMMHRKNFAKRLTSAWNRLRNIKQIYLN